MITLTLRHPCPPTDPSDESVRLLLEIETLYNAFLNSLPTKESLRLYDLPESFNSVTDAELGLGAVIFNVFERLKFFFWSNVYKTRNLIEGLATSLDTENYLTWVLIARSVLEHSAIFASYAQRLDREGVSRGEFDVHTLDALHRCLYQYTNGTRFNWNALLRGELSELKKKYEPPEEDRALNVLTALKHSTRVRPAMADNEIVYNLLSDFAHPNKASHSIYLDLRADFDIKDSVQYTEVLCDAKTPVDRARFLIRLTLPPVAVNIGNIEVQLRALLPTLEIWLRRAQGKFEVRHGWIQSVGE